MSLSEARSRLEPLVGRRGPQLQGSVAARDAARFAIASGDDRDAPISPLLLTSTLEWGAGPPLDALRADGTGVGREAWLPLDGLRLMGGGQDLELEDEPRIGEPFTAVPELESVTFKEQANLLLLVIKTDFHGDDGRLLLRCRETLIAL